MTEEKFKVLEGNLPDNCAKKLLHILRLLRFVSIMREDMSCGK